MPTDINSIPGRNYQSQYLPKSHAAIPAFFMHASMHESVSGFNLLTFVYHDEDGTPHLSVAKINDSTELASAFMSNDKRRPFVFVSVAMNYHGEPAVLFARPSKQDKAWDYELHHCTNEQGADNFLKEIEKLAHGN